MRILKLIILLACLAISNVSLAQELSGSDAALYKKIFALQENGTIDEAARLQERIKDPVLMGHVLYQRYMHPTAYSSSFAELKAWLEKYHDHPRAYKIHALALRKAPSGAPALKKPTTPGRMAKVAEPTMRSAKIYKTELTRTADEQAEAKDTKAEVTALIRARQTKKALRKIQSLEGRSILDPAEIDRLKGALASKLLYSGKMAEAYEIALPAMRRSGEYAPTAAWICALVAWQNQDYPEAASAFEVTATSLYVSGWMNAAASYWAARAHMRSGHIKQVSPWLIKAATNPRTFYGLLATRALGRDFDFNWSAPEMSRQYLSYLRQNPAGARALALNEAGQTDLAEEELLRITPKDNEGRRALLAYAGHAGMPALSMRLGSVLSQGQDEYFDAALYPLGAWKPQGGYNVDQELVHAIIRQESRFDPHAQSGSGARGLMQMMPATAKSVARKSGIALTDLEQLEIPKTNLALGQAYIRMLMEDRQVKSELLPMLIAYNAGPGNLAKWKKMWPEVEDQMLFIELIPSSETRTYVERVLSNYWIYQMRMERPTLTLDALASGNKTKLAMN